MKFLLAVPEVYRRLRGNTQRRRCLRAPAESFGCQSLLGIHWRRRMLDATAALKNGTLSLRFPEPGSAILTNKLTGRSYALSAEPFVLLLEIAGNRP